MPPEKRDRLFERHRKDVSPLVIVALGFSALAAAFVAAASALPPLLKVAVLLTVSAGYAFGCFAVFRKRRNLTFANADSIIPNAHRSEMPDMAPALTTDIEDRLFALEEANLFFGSSLTPSDMFRFVASRVGELLPISAALLWFPDESTGKLRITRSDGRNADVLRLVDKDPESGIASEAFVEGVLVVDPNMERERGSFGPDATNGFGMSAALPLFDKGEPFGVLQLFVDAGTKLDIGAEDIMNAVAERVGPLFLGSFAFERTLSNALTDSLTNLPNERAFFMVLENQLAESQRYRDERPLAIAAIDIKGFADLNSRYGHSTGDAILAFVAEQISVQLRKMDFLARSVNDEFLLILPTAGEKTVQEVIERIETSFAEHAFVLPNDETIRVALNFGYAAFWSDGETAQHLLRSAQMRKHQSKAMEPTKVIWFPKEYVN